ncbi:MAG: 50S ribosomal protein L11 methyltransferase [Betaproteobacteria bacterium]
MSYVALTFDADAATAEAWADALLDAGALSVDVADPHAGTPGESPLYGEPGSPAPGLWQVSRLTALFAGAAKVSTALEDLAAAGRSIPPHRTWGVPEQDWVRATQAQFGPIRIDYRLWIVPSWCEVVDPSAINLALDPGLAFGTGSHPTTRLCLSWLARELHAGESVLDYGCGSGILAIAAAKLGAGRVVGTDIDPQALEASESNARRNDVATDFRAPDRIEDLGVRFDVVVANILANPLILLAPAIEGRVANGGRIVLSGILEAQADAVMTVYRRWFNIAVCESDDGWVALAGTRLDTPRAA